MKRFYGLTADDLEALTEAQDGECAICGEAESRTRDGKPLPLAIDHCHSCGTQRMLLCAACNTAIGLMGDSADRLRRAAEYLDWHARVCR